MATAKKAAAPKPKTYSDYGYATAVVRANPSLKRVMDRAIKGNWTAQKFEGELRNTSWWKKTQESVRRWDVLSKEQPGEARRQISQRGGNVSALAQQLGVSLTKEQRSSISRNSLRFGWTNDEIRRNLASKFSTTSVDKAMSGTAGTTSLALKDMARQYGVTYNAKELQDWTRMVLRGDRTPQDYEDTMRSRAQSKYVGVADEIARGMTTAEIFQQYQNSATQILGINPAEINMADAKWSKAMNYSDPTTGKQRSMNLDEWERSLRNDSQYGWEKTTDAQNQAYLLSSQIRQAFGKGA